MLLETRINQDKVSFQVDRNQIWFNVNDSFIKGDNPNKIAITKWLIKAFKEATLSYNFLYASPYEADGSLEDRVKAFTKLGFTYQYGVVIWFAESIDISFKEKILTQAKLNYEIMNN